MRDFHNRPYFFDSGIFFECLRCGRCCTGDPGAVYVNDKDIGTIASFLSIPASRLIREFLRPYRDSYSIREDDQGRCLFYDRGCAVYPVRPVQCATFPFWFQNLRSLQKWQRTQAQCPGIGKGNHFSKETILELVAEGFSLSAPV